MPTKTETQYQHLEPRPGSNYRQLFLRVDVSAQRLSSRRSTPIHSRRKNSPKSIKFPWRRFSKLLRPP